MALNLIVPITTKEGFEYLLNFTEFSKDHLPVEIDIPVVDVTIEAKVQMKIIIMQELYLIFQVV